MSALLVENLITIIARLVLLGSGGGLLTRGPRVTGTGLSFPQNPSPAAPLRLSELRVPLVYIRQRACQRRSLNRSQTRANLVEYRMGIGIYCCLPEFLRFLAFLSSRLGSVEHRCPGR